MAKPSTNSPKIESVEHEARTASTLDSFIWNFPQKVQKFIESRIQKASRKEPSGIVSAISSSKSEYSSTEVGIDLEKQLQAWKENPQWLDPAPDIHVSVPKGSLCNLSVKVDVALPPDAVYNIVIDPDNRRVFKNIKEVLSRRVLVDEGQRQVVEVEQAALWRFLWWSGTISVHVLVDQNSEDHTMKFKQVKSGFMKRFEGSWKVEPVFVDAQLCAPFKPETLKDYETCTRGKGRVASRVSLDQLIQPSIVPPPPISWYLRGITARTTEMIINDLVIEAARIRRFTGNEDSVDKIDEGSPLHDIKERWALKRRNAKHHRRKLLNKA